MIIIILLSLLNKEKNYSYIKKSKKITLSKWSLEKNNFSRLFFRRVSKKASLPPTY